VIINETHEKFLSKDWLIEDGRASNSVLAMQVLGTKEGLQGTAVLTVDEEFVPVFDMLLLWISMGDQYLESNLTEENASALNGLAQYFGLEQFEQAIEVEQTKREQKHQQDASIVRIAMRLLDRFRDKDIFDDVDNYYFHYGYGSDSSW
jgi:hypothetical protein